MNAKRQQEDNESSSEPSQSESMKSREVEGMEVTREVMHKACHRVSAVKVSHFEWPANNVQE